MHIIKEQLGRINHFLLIMIPLFAVNAAFNLRYGWDGISAIARVYIMVLSFYLVFIFEQINTCDHRADYTARYGWIGKYYLFFVLRLFPFLFIYFLTAIFVLINYLNSSSWPIEPVYKLLDGRFSNTVIYPLLLFVVLRMKKRPGVAIPLFIIFSIIYYIADHELYALLEPGIGVSVIKLSKYIIFIFILVYGYSGKKWRFFQSLALSVPGGIISFLTVASILVMSFYFSSPGSTAFFYSGSIILKSGFVFPVDKLKMHILESGSISNTKTFIEYTDILGVDTGYTPSDWEKIIEKTNIRRSEYIFTHLNSKNIKVNFEVIKNYATSQLLVSPSNNQNLTSFSRHFGLYYNDHKKEFYELYKSGNEPMKILILKSLAYTTDVEAINFLTDKLTSVEKLRSDTAYNSLIIITGEDPASVMQTVCYDINVILFFRDYALKKK